MNNGILVAPKNAQDLANKIKILIQDEQLYYKLSKESRKTILNKFDEKVVKEIIDKLF